MKVALVYDRVNKWGGAERVLLALHEIWPDAPLYTAVYDPARAPWANVFDVRPSFLQHFPFAKSHHELYPWLTQMAFEFFSFDGYDVVISVTSAEAKSIITKPNTLHVCYCLTPTRYLWSGYEIYQETARGFIKTIHKWMTPRLRTWDLVASSRPDYYIAISNRVKDRIEKYYKRTVVKVIYPPVNTQGRALGKGNYFLVVSRLVGYKRIDAIIRAFGALKLPLVIIGQGHAEGELRAMAGENVRFVTRHLTDEELATYYGDCRALVTLADEDFGISTAEALSAGKPVIGFWRSGTAEIVQDNVTGCLIKEQTPEALMQAVQKLKAFDPKVIAQSVRRFDTYLFKQTMKREIERLASL
ncbi:hypothetical protein A2875_03505 [Candidatus Gottesmanbacteria bacterium RIFCSPHIGHO2_01_FULL_46_14]|uniref:Glycosyl transferase family 1 domain-containing protein n=2 Tax=Candidatus Gottesmaniibacteriota TaxID=1752720 RepID=A0A1F5ZPQ9_9BACT|nr:MAG: hypothetical protein A2875_03505 [Candidatus Gottesmanbacteria bacterium RIFCSPHIGHO2_01_FULL_46_14]OGG28821.1 MAG: hypothetical protein A2971_02700 [Candidatus Gottesmanbacteria bacterium RIFCSPLOWO2_01_FULL_46_21]